MNNPITHILTKLETLLGKTPEKDVTTSLLLRLAFYYEAMSVFPETFKGPITFAKIGHITKVLHIDRPEWDLKDVYTDTEPLEWEMGMGSTLEGILDSFKTRSSYGAHYTPQSLVDEVVRAAWRPLFEYHWRQVGGEPEAYIQKLRTLTACDPAMGAGYFLRTVAFELAKEIVYVRMRGSHQPFDWHEYTLHPDSTDRAIQACGVGFMERVQKELPSVLSQCCYGVDIHPMAVEVSKLTLWLYARDLSIPLTFMDSNLLCGDALLGTWSKDLKFSGEGRWPYDATLLLEFYGRRLTIPLEEANSEILLDMVNHLPGAKERTHRALHWELAFPAVFPLGKSAEDRGFDLIVANPPFIGDRMLNRSIGKEMSDRLAEKYTGGKKPDYCGFFFIQFDSLLNSHGSVGSIAPNSLAQGTNRRYILERLIFDERCFQVTRAMPNNEWPGEAKVHYLNINLTRHSMGIQQSHLILPRHHESGDFEAFSVSGRISSYLDDYPERKLFAIPSHDPFFAQQGMQLTGYDFHIVGPNGEIDWFKESIPPHEWSILKSYLNNEDIQQQATPTPSSVVADFFSALNQAPPEALKDEESEKRWLSKSFPTLWGIVAGKNGNPQERNWWRFHRVRSTLRERTRNDHHFLVVGCTIKCWVPTLVPRIAPEIQLEHCLTNAFFVFTHVNDVIVGLLNSFLMEMWARRQSSTLKSDLRFIPTEVFPTFPFPWPSQFQPGTCEITAFPFDENHPSLTPIAESARSLIEIRTNLLANPKSHKLKIGKKWGPTELYNLYDDEEVDNAGIEQLRQAHVNLQQAVLQAYGWDDLAERSAREHWIFDRPWIDRTPRFVPPEEVRREIYVRMGDLNASRYQEELNMFLGRALTVMKGNKYMSLKDIAKALNANYCTADVDGKNEVDIPVLEEALKLGVTTGIVEKHQRGYLPSNKMMDFSRLFFGP